MKNRVSGLQGFRVAGVLLALLLPFASRADDYFGYDFAPRSIWRGTDCADAMIQVSSGGKAAAENYWNTVRAWGIGTAKIGIDQSDHGTGNYAVFLEFPSGAAASAALGDVKKKVSGAACVGRGSYRDIYTPSGGGASPAPTPAPTPAPAPTPSVPPSPAPSPSPQPVSGSSVYASFATLSNANAVQEWINRIQEKYSVQAKPMCVIGQNQIRMVAAVQSNNLCFSQTTFNGKDADCWNVSSYMNTMTDGICPGMGGGQQPQPQPAKGTQQNPYTTAELCAFVRAGNRIVPDTIYLKDEINNTVFLVSATSAETFNNLAPLVCGGGSTPPPSESIVQFGAFNTAAEASARMQEIAVKYGISGAKVFQEGGLYKVQATVIAEKLASLRTACGTFGSFNDSVGNVIYTCEDTISRQDDYERLVAAEMSKIRQIEAGLKKPSGWKTADGNFNGLRMGVDIAGGAVVGTTSGVLTNVLMKKSQLNSGYEAVRCEFGRGESVKWGDSFIVR